MKEIITGSLGYDYIMNFSGRFADRIMPDKLHQISLSFLADKLTKNLGGTAGNLAYTLKLLGVNPHIVSSAGNDFDEYHRFLDSHSIATDGIRVVTNEPTSSYHVVTDRDDNQIGAFYTGAMKYNKELSLPESSNFVVVGPNDPEAMKAYVKACRDKNLRYLYDPAFQIDNMTPEELRFAISGAELLIGNDYEIALIEQKLGISHEELILLGPKAIITTLGAKGSIIETRHDAIAVKPAKPKNVSDPTGAGDAFRGGFLAGYLRALKKLSFDGSKKLSFDEASSKITADDLLVCGQMGSVAAIYTVEKYGTVTHHFTKDEFAKRYKENYSADLVL